MAKRLDYLRGMRVAIVTGAAQGIGRRTAEVLANAGYALALLDLKSTEATLTHARAAGAQAEEFLGDVSDEKVCREDCPRRACALGQG
jgi:NAD(P)-dependent dehydrogenase (short-subunit alcohol dehydrogenase family)